MSLLDIFRGKKKIPAPWAKYYTKKELNISIPNISLYDQISKSAAKYPDSIAYKYFNKKVKYKKFISEIDTAARSFKEYNIKKGDVVTICMPNIPEVLIAFYALNKLGAIANMVHPLSSENEIIESINKTKSKYLIIMDMFTSKIVNNLNEINVNKIIVTKVDSHMDILTKIGYLIFKSPKIKKIKNKNFIPWKKFIKIGKKSHEQIKCIYGKDTPCVILASGGTSGKSKLVVIQNRSFILASKQEKIALRNLNQGDCCLAIMPNFHGFGLSVTIHTPLALGCYTILIPQFDAKKFDTLFKKTKPNCVLGVPTLFEALINSKNEKNLDLSCLKYVVSGGDYLSKKLEDQVNKYLKEHNSMAKITQGYGLSEALAAVALACDDVNKSGSVGIPLAGNHIKIIDPSTRESKKAGEVGEICIHSSALMMGYLNDEVETNNALQVHKDNHIWLHTGDLGYMDEDGFLFYSGREKRMIVTSGYNVYPSHLEEIIEKHPAVLQCTVVGVPHPYKHEVPKAFIVLKPGYYSLFVKNEIKEYCKKNMAKYMIPKEFVYRKSLPRTKLGKVDFQKLKSDIGLDDV